MTNPPPLPWADRHPSAYRMKYETDEFVIYGALNPEDALTHPDMDMLCLARPDLWQIAVNSARNMLMQRVVNGCTSLFTPEQLREVCEWAGVPFNPPLPPITPEGVRRSEERWRVFHESLKSKAGSIQELSIRLSDYLLYGAPLNPWWVWYGDYAECPECAFLEGKSARERGLTPVSSEEVVVDCSGCGISPTFNK